MSKLYNIIDPITDQENKENNENDYLVSKEYVDARIKALEDTVKDHINDYAKAHTMSSEVHQINPCMDEIEKTDLIIHQELPEMNPENFNEDANHRFISEGVLNALKNKPTLLEMEAAINNAKNEMKVLFNDLYTNLLNMPNAVNTLKEISTFLQDDATALNSIFNSLSLKVDESELDEHAASNKHVSNNDRKALNYLLELVKSGIDWNNDNADNPFAIKNKPESFKANGGNSSTVGGIEPKDFSHSIENLVIGFKSKDLQSKVDLLINDTIVDQMTEELTNAIQSTNGVIAIKDGDLNITSFDFCKKNHTIINGSGYSTVINGFSGTGDCKLVTINDITIKSFKNITIGYGCEFDRVVFENCNFTFEDAQFCRFNHCRFANCKFTIKSMYSCFITENFFYNCEEPKWISDQCVIKDNVHY